MKVEQIYNMVAFWMNWVGSLTKKEEEGSTCFVLEYGLLIHGFLILLPML